MSDAHPVYPSTVGRGRAIARGGEAGGALRREGVELRCGDSAELYAGWPQPTVIVSDGAYGVLGFDGDTADHGAVARWYEPHIRAWGERALPSTTLWFWNSEIGWAATHPALERGGWRYVQCNVWNKGVCHVAGNSNTRTIRRFPVVSEVCVQYVREVRVGGRSVQAWMLAEWRRSGLPLRRANDACGVRHAAVRKYFDQGHLWYAPPPEAMERIARYANERGDPAGRPYFALDGREPVTAAAWGGLRAKFRCPPGLTNVWDRGPVRGAERIKTSAGRSVHLNQKPLDLMERIIGASSDPGDEVWEPFGGLFTASLAAWRLGRRARGAELDPAYFALGAARFG